MTAELKGIHAKTFQDLDVIKDVLKLDEEQIEDLEKENAELQHKVDTLQGFLDRDVEFDNLQKENAELKARIGNLKDEFEYSENYGKRVQKERHRVVNDNAKLRDQLTKAKEIIEKLRALYLSPVVTKDDVKQQDEILNEAEAFLNSEVEK